MVFGWPIAWLVVVVFEFACDGLVAERTKRTLRSACVLVIKFRQIGFLVAVQPACMVPLSAWITIFCWIHSNKISTLIRKPELTNGVARVDRVERKTAEQRIKVVSEKPFDAPNSRQLAKRMTDHGIVVDAGELMFLNLLHCEAGELAAYTIRDGIHIELLFVAHCTDVILRIARAKSRMINKRP